MGLHNSSPRFARSLTNLANYHAIHFLRHHLKIFSEWLPDNRITRCVKMRHGFLNALSQVCNRTTST